MLSIVTTSGAFFHCAVMSLTTDSTLALGVDAAVMGAERLKAGLGSGFAAFFAPSAFACRALRISTVALSPFRSFAYFLNVAGGTVSPASIAFAALSALSTDRPLC